jgi:hypothetical protein
MSDRTIICTTCNTEYDPKGNVMGLFGGHSPDQCIQALKQQLEYKEIVCKQHAAMINHLSKEIEGCPCECYHEAEAEKQKQLTLDALAEAAKRA